MNNEIACSCYEDAAELALLLLKNNYVVMISREEELYIVNYEWSCYCDRNDVIFMNRDTFEMEHDRECKKCMEMEGEDNA